MLKREGWPTVIRALLLGSAVTLAASVAGRLLPLLGFILLAPGVLLASVLGVGHAEGMLLAFAASWIVYCFVAYW